jgi:hypothetical protein
MTSKVFFISIPISLEALQQHNPKSPNLVYNGREPSLYSSMGEDPKEGGAPLVEKMKDKCERWAATSLQTPRRGHM